MLAVVDALQRGVERVGEAGRLGRSSPGPATRPRRWRALSAWLRSRICARSAITRSTLIAPPTPPTLMPRLPSYAARRCPHPVRAPWRGGSAACVRRCRAASRSRSGCRRTASVSRIAANSLIWTMLPSVAGSSSFAAGMAASRRRGDPIEDDVLGLDRRRRRANSSARWMTFSSSRTLPGQSCAASRSIASRGRPGHDAAAAGVAQDHRRGERGDVARGARRAASVVSGNTERR